MRPFDGSMIIEVRHSPLMIRDRHAAVGPEQVVVADRRERGDRFDLLVAGRSAPRPLRLPRLQLCRSQQLPLR